MAQVGAYEIEVHLLLGCALEPMGWVLGFAIQPTGYPSMDHLSISKNLLTRGLFRDIYILYMFMQYGYPWVVLG